MKPIFQNGGYAKFEFAKDLSLYLSQKLEWKIEPVLSNFTFEGIGLAIQNKILEKGDL